jgi:hypothetical protein
MTLKKNIIEITGASLIPSFSVYVLEVTKEKEKWYYVGMTGDNHYPSARSPFHRLSGHLELVSTSTQNQLRGYIASKIFGLKETKELNSGHLNQIDIRMHHFPIDGFTPWNFGGMHKENLSKNQKHYDDYKLKQRSVARIEERVIGLGKEKFGDRILNAKGTTRQLQSVEDEKLALEIFREVFNG